MKASKFLFSVVLTIVAACDISNNNVEPMSTFTKIYDDSRFEHEYFPLDVIQTADEGFLILSEKKMDQSLFTNVFVLKADAMGNVVSNTEMDASYVHPVNGWQYIAGSYYFICMDANTLTAQLVPVDESGALGDPVSLGVSYPLVATQDGDNIVLLSFDNGNNETVISLANASGQISQQASYTIGAGVDVEKPIIDHLTRNGDELPFAVGKSSDGTYYFNGFYNYTFSLVFTSFGGSPTGVCQGQLSEGGVSAVAPVSNGAFNVSRFNFGANYLTPLASISTSSTTSSVDLEGNIFPEIESGARVKIGQTESGNWLYATQTQSKQLVLYSFDESGTILGTQYMGSGNPYSFASFCFTSDGGIAILAKTALEGRFPRIALLKRDGEFLEGF